MKTLVVFYSRTGHAKSLADVLAAAMNADIEHVLDVHPFKGPFGYIRGGYVAMRKMLTHICPPRFQPRDYDQVIVVTPVWANRAAPAIRNYLDQYGDMCKKLQLFTVSKGPVGSAVRDDLESAFNIGFENAVGFTDKDIKKGDVLERLKAMAG